MSVEPIILEGGHVRLAPLSLTHHARLCEIGLDERLWRSTTIQLQTAEDMLKYIQTAMQGRDEGTAAPFVIIEKDSGKVVGTTRYHSIDQLHRRLEIGFTWIAVERQRSIVNTEAKYLMLKHAFEQRGCVRVQFKADRGNEQSCRALIRIGAKQEGVLRKYITSAHKGARDLVLFSIIDTEWPEVKANLESKLGLV